jgi:hypothetical protein
VSVRSRTKDPKKTPLREEREMNWGEDWKEAPAQDWKEAVGWETDDSKG